MVGMGYFYFIGSSGTSTRCLDKILGKSYYADSAQMRIMFENLERNIPKMVKASAAEFGNCVEGNELYVPDFFQIFPAKTVLVGII